MSITMKVYNNNDIPALITELRAELDGYEQRYGIKSEDLGAALTSGQIEETFEICSWWISYDLWKRLKGETE